MKYILFFLPLVGLAQNSVDWISAPKEKWPTIALTNHVAYKNGDSYVHTSFKYAATGFLIDYNGRILAATAKHVLMVAPNKKSKFVEINEHLQSWVLKTKPISDDSVVVDQLINEDAKEIFGGSESTIMQRDWLVFSTKYVSKNIQALKPRFSEVQKGETVYMLECAYEDEDCQINEGKVFRKEGMDILIERVDSKNKGGASGSPVIDKNGFLIGVLSSSATASRTLKNVTVAVSTEYLKDVLERKEGLNNPKEDYGSLLLKTVNEKGSKAAIKEYKRLIRNQENYYNYNLRDANKNGLSETGEKLMKEGRVSEAISFFKLNIKNQPAFFRNYNLLADAYYQIGDIKKARKFYALSTKRYDNDEENPAFKKLSELK